MTLTIIILVLLLPIVYALGRIHERLEWIKWWGYEIKNNYTPEIGKVFERNPSLQQPNTKNPFSIRNILLLDGKEYRDQ